MIRMSEGGRPSQARSSAARTATASLAWSSKSSKDSAESWPRSARAERWSAAAEVAAGTRATISGHSDASPPRRSAEKTPSPTPAMLAGPARSDTRSSPTPAWMSASAAANPSAALFRGSQESSGGWCGCRANPSQSRHRVPHLPVHDPKVSPRGQPVAEEPPAPLEEVSELRKDRLDEAFGAFWWTRRGRPQGSRTRRRRGGWANRRHRGSGHNPR